jgi:hypothetical protein
MPHSFDCRCSSPPDSELKTTVCHVLVAQSLDPPAFPQSPRLPAGLASTKGLLLGGFNAVANDIIQMVYMDSQPTIRRILHPAERIRALASNHS